MEHSGAAQIIIKSLDVDVNVQKCVNKLLMNMSPTGNEVKALFACADEIKANEITNEKKN